MKNLIVCQNCKFGNDRDLGGNRLVCVNENSDSCGQVVRSHWAGCSSFVDANPQQSKSAKLETLDWDGYRERQQAIQGRDSDRVMERFY